MSEEQAEGCDHQDDYGSAVAVSNQCVLCGKEVPPPDAPLDVERLADALHNFYGERKDDTCWHDHDAKVIAAAYEEPRA